MNQKVILTFDDGPHTNFGNLEILKVLDKHHIKALFFVTGQLTLLNADMLKEIHNRGHDIGNHSFTHARLLELNDEEVRSEIRKTQIIVKHLIGKIPVYFRPPYGECRPETRQMIENEFNLKYVTWGINTYDWKRQGIDMKEVNRCLKQNLSETTMILMHVTPETSDALDEFIDWLKLQGITICNATK